MTQTAKGKMKKLILLNGWQFSETGLREKTYILLLLWIGSGSVKLENTIQSPDI